MDYVIAKRELPQQPIVSIRDRCAQGDIPGFVGTAFGELFGRLGLLGVEPAGPPFVIYHEFGPDGVDAEVSVPIAQAVSATGRIKARVLPAVTVAGTLHVGPYDDLGAAYAALTEWIRSNGFEATGPFQERYLNGPGDQVSPAEYRTEVEIPIVAAAVAVPV
ncbi:MAG: GyrI-like domain-containing protein [Candidatus Limnocylindrales bacterium]